MAFVEPRAAAEALDKRLSTLTAQMLSAQAMIKTLKEPTVIPQTCSCGTTRLHESESYCWWCGKRR